jgi:hypothetical protein
MSFMRWPVKLLRAGRAGLHYAEGSDGWDGWIRLVPTNTGACPAKIMARSRQIDLIAGPTGFGWNHEIYAREEADRLGELRLCLLAVVAGDYEGELVTEETHFLRWRWETTYFAGTFHTEDGDITFSHHGLGTHDEGRQERRTFKPY